MSGNVAVWNRYGAVVMSAVISVAESHVSRTLAETKVTFALSSLSESASNLIEFTFDP